MNSKLWKMMEQKIIWNVEGKKGVYTTIPQLTLEDIDLEGGPLLSLDDLKVEEDLPF